jgi:hypothetical protein
MRRVEGSCGLRPSSHHGRVRCLIAILSIAAAAGCATEKDLRPGAPNPAKVTDSINLSGYPPEFRRGFTDGCTAARANAAATRPPGEGQYLVGWKDGFDYCKRRN